MEVFVPPFTREIVSNGQVGQFVSVAIPNTNEPFGAGGTPYPLATASIRCTGSRPVVVKVGPRYYDENISDPEDMPELYWYEQYSGFSTGLYVNILKSVDDGASFQLLTRHTLSKDYFYQGLEFNDLAPNAGSVRYKLEVVDMGPTAFRFMGLQLMVYEL